MKRFIVLLLAVIFHSPIIPYSQEKRIEISLNGGVSFPVGNYNATNLENGSFATTGFTFGADINYFIWKRLGVGIYASANYHPPDVGILGYEKVKNDQFLIDLYIKSDNYQVMLFTAGIHHRIPFLKKFHWDAKLLFGAAWAKTPYQLYKPEYFLVEGKWYEITSSVDWSPAIVTGTGFSYLVNDYFTINLAADFAYTNMQFGFVTNGEFRIDERQIMIVNIYFGFSVLF